MKVTSFYTLGLCLFLLLGGCGSNSPKVTILNLPKNEFQAVVSAASEIDAVTSANKAAGKRCQAMGKNVVLIKIDTKKIEPEAIDKAIGKTAEVIQAIDPVVFFLPNVKSEPTFHTKMRFKCQ